MNNLMKVLVVLSLLLPLVSCAAPQAEKLELVTVKPGSLVASIPTTGTVTPCNRLEVKPPVAGRIDSVLVVEGQRISKGQVLAWMSSLERATLIDAARAKGAAEVKRWEEIYRPTPIIAPINGFLILRQVEPGQSFSTSDVVLVMADYLIVKAQVDETDIGRIKLNQPVEIILDAYPQQPVKGKVEHIAYESQVVNNVVVYTVNVAPISVPAYFRSGMSATVNFIQQEKDQTLLLPLKAVKKRGKLSYVFLFKKEGEEPEALQVEAGLQDDSNIEIKSGLKVGEQVAIPNAALLKKLNPDHRPMGFNPFGGGQRRN